MTLEAVAQPRIVVRHCCGSVVGIATWLRLLLVVVLTWSAPPSVNAMPHSVVCTDAGTSSGVSLLRLPAVASAMPGQGPEAIRSPSLLPKVHLAALRVAVHPPVVRDRVASPPPPTAAREVPSCRGPPA